MEWLWQGIITTFICSLLGNFFSYIKKCVLIYYRYEKSRSTSKTVYNLYWKGYICVFISQVSVCYMFWNFDNDDLKIPIAIASILFCISNIYLFYSLLDAKNKFTYKKTNNISQNNSNNIEK